MDRRRFLTLSAGALLTPRSWLGNLSRAQEQPQSTVFEVRGISDGSVAGLMTALGGIEAFLPGDPARATVVLKPNLCLPDPERRATTTSSSVTEHFVRYFVGAGVKRILIVDHTLHTAEDFKGIAHLELEERYPAVKVLLANEERMFQPVAVQGKALKEVAILKLLGRADVFVNLPTAKHHSATHVSLGIKNLMGCIWNRVPFHTSMDLSQAIGDLALAVRPTITVIDATRVLLNGGPTGPGPIVNDNRLFASRDILAVDSVVTSRYPFGGKTLSAREVPHLLATYENAVGEIDLANIITRSV